MNHHLIENENYSGDPINNFGTAIKDSTIYQNLLEKLQEHEMNHTSNLTRILRPNIDSEKNLIARATHTIKMAANLNCKAFVRLGLILARLRLLDSNIFRASSDVLTYSRASKGLLEHL